MKTLITAVLFTLFSTVVNAANIPLAANNYWQVQNSKTYETVCEGYITSCTVASDNYYNVINLTTGQRNDRVYIQGIVASTPTTSPPSTKIVSNRCEDAMTCPAICPVATKPTGGSCYASNGRFVSTNSVLYSRGMYCYAENMSMIMAIASCSN